MPREAVALVERPRVDAVLLYLVFVGLFAAPALWLAGYAVGTRDARADAGLAVAILGAITAHVFLVSGGGRALRVARAFVRRGLLVLYSYKFQVVLFFAQVGIFVSVLILLGEPLVEALFMPVGDAMASYTNTNYVVFLLLGIAGWPFLWGSYQVSTQQVRKEQLTGLFEVLVPTPAGVTSLPFAYFVTSLGSTVSGLAITLAVFHRILPDGALSLASPRALLAFTAIAGLAGVTMWGLGLVIGGLTAVFKEASAASALLRFVLIAFAGIYVPVELLPGWAVWVSRLLPLTYAFEAMRGVLSGEGALLVDHLFELGVLTAFALVASVGGLRMFRWLIDRARRAGTLSGY